MSPSFRGLRMTAVMAVCALVMTSCGGGDYKPQGPGVGAVRECQVEHDLGWPGAFMRVDKPTNCPVSIPTPRYDVAFASDGSFSAGSSADYEFTTIIQDANALLVSYNITHIHNVSTPSFGDDRLEVFGRYWAGNAGFSVPDKTDRSITRIRVNGSVWKTATGLLTYTQGAPMVSANAPSAVNYGTQFALWAGLHDTNAIPPVTYAWTLEGQTISTARDFSWPSGPEGNVQFFEVSVTDGRGITNHASTQVWTRCADPNNTGPQCQEPYSRAPVDLPVLKPR